MVTARLVIAVLLTALLPLSGCTVNRVINSPPPVDVERIKVGESRQTITSILGEPKSSEVKEAGRIERYEFVSGYSTTDKVAGSILYGALDILSYGIAEFFFSSPEKKLGSGTAGCAVVEYGMDDLARSALVTKADGKPWEYPGQAYVEPPPELPPEPPLQQLPPPQIEPPRVVLPPGRIALVVQDNFKTDMEIPNSSIFSAAGKGAASGGLIGFSVGLICYYGWIICSPVLGTAGGIIGSVVGPIAATPSSSWAAANKAYFSTIIAIDAKSQISKDLVRIAGQRGYDTFLLVEDRAHDQRDSTRYSALAKDGVSGILEISSLSVSFEPVERVKGSQEWPIEINPPRFIIPRAHVRFIGTIDGAVLIEKDITNSGRMVRYIEDWLANDAQLLRDDIVEAVPRLAESIVSEIFELQPKETEKLEIDVGRNDVLICDDPQLL